MDAWCADYRAGATTDLEHDKADLGRTMDVPALVLWGECGVVGWHDPLAAWRRWFPGAVGHGVDAGHFLAEERIEIIGPLVAGHLAASG